MKLNKLITFILLLFSPFAVLLAQNSSKGYYIFPIRPGEINYLSGNMGELRSNHFHSGIDIKTGGEEGLPVFAAAEGYISRIKMSSWGYGNTLYILHPNGETTVYAHLQRFGNRIQEYVRAAQYKEKTFEIELFPEKNQFPVIQGEIIAFSGNTGGSGGPHLHFEIRDKNQEVLNPLTYGFKEIKDDIAPEIEKIAFVTLEKDARIQDLFGRFEFDVARKGTNYFLNSPVFIHGKVGIEILGYDQSNGASNKNGIARIEVNLDDKPVFSQNITKFSFSETRDILVFHNYPAYKKTGERFYKLYIDEGNQLPFYENKKNKGIIVLKDSALHEVTINFWDSYQNKSTLNFKIYNKPPVSQVTTKYAKKRNNISYAKIHENVLKISSLITEKPPPIASIHANRMVYDQQPDYYFTDNAVYLWDLTRGLPDSVLIGNDTWKFNFRATIPSGKVFSLFTPYSNIYFPKTALYDTLYIQTGYWQDGSNERFSISEDLFPLQRNISITLKPMLNYPKKSRTHIYSVSNSGNFIFEGGEWQDEHIKFNTRNFGEYTLLIDTIAPTIRPVKLSKEEIKFVISDEQSGIHSYEAFINGEWLLMHYDYKRDLIWSDRLDKNLLLTGEFMLKVRDQAGNQYIYTTNL